MRPFATALLLAQTLAASVEQTPTVGDTSDDYMLACLDLMTPPDPDYCTPLNEIRADFELKIETVRDAFNAHVADDA